MPSFRICIFKGCATGTHLFRQNPWENVGFCVERASSGNGEKSALWNETDMGCVLMHDTRSHHFAAP